VVASRETFAGPMTLLFGDFNGVGIYLIDAPHLYDRPGNPYHDPQMQDYPDNVLRFALLSWVAAELAGGLDPFWRPEIVHAHDWHAGLTPAYLAARGNPARSVFTVHNIAYQGLFLARHMAEIALPWSFFQMHGVEFKGQISFLKAGLYFADHITTVSPTYAREITEPQYAFGLEELLRQRQREGRLSGILNGVDESIWDPRRDPLLAAPYDRNSLAEKAKNKQQLQTTLGLKEDGRALLFTVVSRLTSQKGLDLPWRTAGNHCAGRAAGATGIRRPGFAGPFSCRCGAILRAGEYPDRLRRGAVASDDWRRRRHPGAQPF
jgi:starch synthase